MVEHDPVNHPSHYTSHPSGVECIEITRWMPFNPGNAMKYLWRAGQKENAPTKQDYEKAIWYIQDEIKRLFPEKPEHIKFGDEWEGRCRFCGKDLLPTDTIKLHRGLVFHQVCFDQPGFPKDY